MAAKKSEKIYSAYEAAARLGIDPSRVLQLCRKGRLGYTLPKFGRAWVITEKELEKFEAIGPLPAGRPKKEE